MCELNKHELKFPKPKIYLLAYYSIDTFQVGKNRGIIIEFTLSFSVPFDKQFVNNIVFVDKMHSLWRVSVDSSFTIRAKVSSIIIDNKFWPFAYIQINFNLKFFVITFLLTIINIT